MRAVCAVLAGLLVCGVIGSTIGGYLPAQWGTIIGALVGACVGWSVYGWLRRVG